MQVLDDLAPNAHWLLRIGIAAVFLYHGLTKFPGLQVAGLPTWVAVLVALAEIVGGAFVFLGAFDMDWMTRLGALLPIPVMVGAISMFHWGRWSFTPTDGYPIGGMEFQTTLILVLLYILIKGNEGLEA